MRRLRPWLAVLVLSTLMLVFFGAVVFHTRRSHFDPALFPSKETLYTTLQSFVEMFRSHRENFKVELSGTPGTPVVVGYEVDRFGARVFGGVLPTNFTVRGARCLYLAVKNVGKEAADLWIVHHNVRVGGGTIPPLFGWHGQQKWSSRELSNQGDIALPTDWPVTLPPGMTEREARTHDFMKDFYQGVLGAFQSRLGENPKDQRALFQIGEKWLALHNYPAAREAYEKFFAVDPDDPTALNVAVYHYVEIGGTNLDRAYELALKAQQAQRSSCVADTVGWVLFKRGDYAQALQVLVPIRRQSPEITFHAGMAYYMNMDEAAARASFQEFLRWGSTFAEEANEARRCLEVFDVKQDAPTAEVVNRLKARLAQVPDDPVALDRLAEMCERDGVGSNDSLVTKSLGWLAYRRGQYGRAVECLTASGKERTTDADLFFYLGMACYRLNQTDRCTDSFRKALALNIKPSRAEEARKLLASLCAK